MSTYDDKKDAKGRSWDQVTKDGSSSAGSMGAGGTGNKGKLTGEGSTQSAGRTDDLLDDGSASEGDKGFSSGDGRVDTGLEGMGKQGGGAQGNRQSGTPGAQDDKPENKGQ